MSIDIEDIEGAKSKPDFRRANGAPMIRDRDGKNQRFSRPSGWGKTLDDENALVNWKIDTASKGVALDSSLQAEWSAVKDDDRESKTKLREKAIQAGRGNQAADTGTALHAMSERWEDPDDNFNPPAKYRTSLETYSAEMDRIGVVTELMEFHVVNEEYRAAGTCDRLYRLTRDLVAPNGEILPAGTLVIGDLKTGKSLDFSLPGYHVQMAIYAQGEFYNVEEDVFMPTPEINCNWGLIVWMPAEGPNAGICEMQWCDLEVGNYGAWLVSEVKDWRRKWNNGTYGSPLVSLDASPSVEPPAPTAPPIGGGTTSLDVQFVEIMVPFIKLRLAQIRSVEDASAEVQMTWPEGVPGPGKIEADWQVTAVLDLLDKIEAKYGLQFPEGDPRVPASGHNRDFSITNTAPGVVRKEATS